MVKLSRHILGIFILIFIGTIRWCHHYNDGQAQPLLYPMCWYGIIGNDRNHLSLINPLALIVQNTHQVVIQNVAEWAHDKDLQQRWEETICLLLLPADCLKCSHIITMHSKWWRIADFQSLFCHRVLFACTISESKA